MTLPATTNTKGKIMIQFLHDHQVALLAIGFGLSELLALVPGIKANSVFQLISNPIVDAYNKVTNKQA